MNKRRITITIAAFLWWFVNILYGSRSTGHAADLGLQERNSLVSISVPGVYEVTVGHHWDETTEADTIFGWAEDLDLVLRETGNSATVLDIAGISE